MRRNLSILAPLPTLTSAVQGALLVGFILCQNVVFCWAAVWAPGDPTGNGVLTDNTTLTLSSSEAVTVNTALSGNYSLTVSGEGTLELQGQNTYTGATNLNGGATLKLSTKEGNLTKSSQLTIGSHSTLELAINNALGYVTHVQGFLQTIQMETHSQIVNSVTDNHSNLGNLTISGTGAQITGTGNGSATYGNFLLAGKITLTEGASATFDVYKLTIRKPDASLKDGTLSQAGIFEVGANATMTLGSTERNATILVYDQSNGITGTTITKTGAGTLTVNGRLQGTIGTETNPQTSRFVHQAGISNLNGNVSNVALSVSGGTVVANGLILGSRDVSVTGGTLEIRGGTYYDNNSKFTGNVTVSGAGSKLALYKSYTSLSDATGKVTISNGGELEGNTVHPFGYQPASMLNAIHLENGGILTNNASGGERQMSVPALNITGIGNLLRSSEANETGHSTIGNFAFAGNITLAENAGLTLDAKKVVIRNTANTQNNAVVTWETGAGAEFTVNAGCDVRLMDGVGTTLTKTGAGTLTVNGTLTGMTGSLYAHQAGTTHLKGTVSNLALSVSGGTLNASGGITGTSSVEITGGTMVLEGEYKNTYSGATNVSNGGTLKLNSSFALNSNTSITLDQGILEMARSNAISYASNTSFFVKNITMKNGSTILNSASGNHQNLGNILVSGVGNTIRRNGTDNGSTYGNYFFGGNISLEENAELTIDIHKATLRKSHGLQENGVYQGGRFNIGENAVLKANINTLNMFDNVANDISDVVKTGTGTMIFNGTISGGGNVRIEEGLLALSGDQKYTGTTTIQNGGVLGIGEGTTTGELTLIGDMTVETGGRIAMDLSAGNDLLTLGGALTLEDGAFLELNFLDAMEVGSGVEFLQADAFLNELGEAIAQWSDYIVGLPGNYVVLQLGDALWVTDRASVPEPGTWGMLLLGLILGFRNWRKNRIG